MPIPIPPPCPSLLPLTYVLSCLAFITYFSLHFFFAIGYVDIVNYLLEQGSLRDARDDDGCTPIFAAADEGNVKLRKQDRLLIIIISTIILSPFSPSPSAAPSLHVIVIVIFFVTVTFIIIVIRHPHCLSFCHCHFIDQDFPTSSSAWSSQVLTWTYPTTMVGLPCTLLPGDKKH